MTTQRGFTIIEVLAAVAIVAILAAIAIPLYQDSVVKGRRSDGMALALDLAANQEQFFMQNNTYTTDITGNTGLDTKDSSKNGHYAATAAACTGGSIADCFIVTVTATGSQAGGDDNCRAFTIDNAGVKASINAQGNPSLDCW